jgi:CCR4-NOT transcription complex subunit 2
MFWDAENWAKGQKEMTMLYADLEQKNVPVFMAGPGPVLSQSTAGQGQVVAITATAAVTGGPGVAKSGAIVAERFISFFNCHVLTCAIVL